MTKRRSSSERRAATAAAFALLVRRLGRRAGRRGADPNDRQVDHEIEQAARRMRPEALDALLRDGEED